MPTKQIIGQRFHLKPFGPYSPKRCWGEVVAVNEEKKTLTLADNETEIEVSFDLWWRMEPEYFDHYQANLYRTAP